MKLLIITPFFLIHFIFSLLLALLFRRTQVFEHDKTNKMLIITFSLTFIVVTEIITSFSRSFECTIRGHLPQTDGVK